MFFSGAGAEKLPSEISSFKRCGKDSERDVDKFWKWKVFFFFWGKDGEFERGREEEDEKMGREMNKIEESRLLLQKMSTV